MSNILASFKATAEHTTACCNTAMTEPQTARQALYVQHGNNKSVVTWEV